MVGEIVHKDSSAGDSLSNELQELNEPLTIHISLGGSEGDDTEVSAHRHHPGHPLGLSEGTVDLHVAVLGHEGAVGDSIPAEEALVDEDDGTTFRLCLLHPLLCQLILQGRLLPGLLWDLLLADYYLLRNALLLESRTQHRLCQGGVWEPRLHHGDPLLQGLSGVYL